MRCGYSYEHLLSCLELFLIQATKIAAYSEIGGRFGGVVMRRQVKGRLVAIFAYPRQSKNLSIRKLNFLSFLFILG